MILNFSIENTLSIRDRITISFDANASCHSNHIVQIANKNILRLKCLYGDNASGKTNIIEAFTFYLNFLLNSFSELKPDESTHFMPFKFSKDHANAPGCFQIVFFIGEIRYEYFISTDSKRVIKENLFFSPNGQKSLLFERELDEVSWGVAFKGQKKAIKESLRMNASVLSTGAQLNNKILLNIHNSLSSYFKGSISIDKGMLLGLTLKRLEENEAFKAHTIQLLSKISSNSITDIRIESESIPDDFFNDLPIEFKQRLMKNGSSPKKRKAFMLHQFDESYELPLNFESSGTQRLIELATPLFDLTNKNAMVFIDELETSLHQKTQEFFLKKFLESSSDSQLLFTTHNTDLMDMGLLNDDEICFAIKDNSGNTMIAELSDYTGIRKNSSRKHLYEDGRFDKLPSKANK